jgi:hypothetical protein
LSNLIETCVRGKKKINCDFKVKLFSITGGVNLPGNRTKYQVLGSHI